MGPVPASWGVAGLDLACLCRRPGQLHLSLVRTRRSGTRACWPRPARRIAWSSWLLVLAPRRPGGRRRRPAQAWSQLVGHDLDDLPGAAVLGRPCPLLESTRDHDPAALGQGLGGVLGLVAPDDHGEERRLLLPAAGDGHPERGPGDPTLGVPQLGVVGEVAGEADACLGHGVPLSVAWPGGLPCPWNRGTVDTVACRQTARGKRRSQ